MTNLIKLIEVLSLAIEGLNQTSLADGLIYFEKAFILKQQVKKDKQQKQQNKAFAVDKANKVQRILFEKPAPTASGLNLQVLTEETTEREKHSWLSDDGGIKLGSIILDGKVIQHQPAATDANGVGDQPQLRKLSDEELNEVLKDKKYQTIYRSPSQFNNADLGPLDRSDFDDKGFRKTQ